MSNAQSVTWKSYKNLLKEQWQDSKWFRAFLVLALIWVVLRLIIQVVFSFTDIAGNQTSIDLQVYLDASRHFAERVDLYPESLEILEYHFPYPPIFAMLFSPFGWLPGPVNVAVQLLLRIGAYLLILVRWGKIFQRWNLEKAARALVLTLPAWLVFSVFWDDLGYINIYTIMALLGTLLIEAVLKEDLPASVTWLTLILVTKPHWAFAAAIPLLLGHYRFFIKLILWSLAAYLGLAVLTGLVGGFGYVWTQYQDYIALLGRLGREFPWRGPDAGFLGYNHSVKQVLAYLLGPSDSTLLAGTVVKFVLLVPLGMIALYRLIRPIRETGGQVPFALEMALLLYLGVFIWLDILWEAFLTIAVFGYLLSISQNKSTRAVIFTVFLPYALLDFWRVVCFAAGSPFIDEAYLQRDYSIHIPLTLIVVLVFYGFMIVKTWPWRRESRLPSNS